MTSRTVGGRYTLGRVFGVEGLWTRFAATDTSADRGVVIDVFKVSAPPETSARLALALERSRKLRSDHAVPMIDVGTTDEGEHFVVWGEVAGEPLAARLGREGPLSPHAAASAVRQACSAVAEAHALGMVHLDLRPATLIAENGTFVRVIGLGSAPAVLTGALVRWGSPFYMSPERLRKGREEPPADVWSLGVTLYELVAGRPPFEGEQMKDVFISILTKPPPPLAGAPPELERVVLACLEKDPEKRPTTAGLLDALGPFEN